MAQSWATTEPETEELPYLFIPPVEVPQALSEFEKQQVNKILIRGTTKQTSYQVIIGTPEECLQKILRYESVGVDQLLCYVQFGDLPHEKVMRNLELLAREVMPKLEERGHRVDATVTV